MLVDAWAVNGLLHHHVRYDVRTTMTFGFFWNTTLPCFGRRGVFVLRRLQANLDIEPTRNLDLLGLRSFLW